MKSKIKNMLPIRIIILIRKIKISIIKSLMYIMRIFPVNEIKVVACNFNGKGYGDNCKNVVEKLSDENYKIIWLIKEYDPYMPQFIKQIKYGSIRALYHLSTAKFWIDNNRKEAYIVKRSNQIYIQMWHGSIALKRIEKDVQDILNPEYVKNAKYDSTLIDLMISNSSFSDNLFSNSFWYKGEILKCGTPRIDTLFKENSQKIKSDFCEKYNIDKNSEFVIYAPTFRDSMNLNVYNFDKKKIIECFERKYKKKFYLLIRLHPNLKGIVDFEQDVTEHVIDVSEYPDIYELMHISNFLITDYSSTMFEFPIATRKGVFIFAKDINEYNRGFYFNINDLPFSISTNSNELIENIINFNHDIYKEKIDEFFNEISLLEDGLASQRLVNYIKNISIK